MQQESKGALYEIQKHRGQFSIAFVVIFSAIFIVLALTGLTPDPATTSANTTTTPDSIPVSSQQQVTPSPTGQGELPVRIVAPTIKLNVAVVNPMTTDVDLLDKALEKGAARYPTSAQLGVDGTVLLFGHSSYLPLVHNLFYKTFDGIQNLKQGDIVSVYSATTEYRYSVISVTIKNSTADSVDLTGTGKHLTLVTCDSFGQKTDRFVVTADFVGAYPLQ